MIRTTRVRVAVGDAVYEADAEAILDECRMHYGEVSLDTLRRYGIADQDTRADLYALKVEMAAGRAGERGIPRPAVRVSP